MKSFLNTSPFFNAKFWICVFCLAFTSHFSQITLNQNATLTQYIQSITGASGSVSNVTVNCPNGAIASFTNNTSNIGISNGVLLTTGQVNLVNGPNNFVSAGFNNGAPGDLDLNNLAIANTFTNATITTFDACAIEFDYISVCDTLAIEYVFGSEEYPEYVNRQFNDIFGFFISGPNPSGGNYVKDNIAVIPNTNNPVSVNTINAGANTNLFIDNTNGASIQYDGFTTLLTAKKLVLPCANYHLKLVIADILDGIFDSGVFFRGRSCPQNNFNNVGASVDAIKNCSNGSFTFCRSGSTALPYTINYQVGGTAINGTDYAALPLSVTIPANQTCITTSIVPIYNAFTGSSKTVKIMYQYGFCQQNDTLNITIVEPTPIDAGPNVAVCSGDSIVIGNSPLANTSYSWQTTTGLSNPFVASPKLSLQNNTNSDIVLKYLVFASTPQGGSCPLRDSLNITIRSLPTMQINMANSNCAGTAFSYTNNTTASIGSTIANWYWNFGNSSFSTSQNPIINYASSGTYSITVQAIDNNGCKDDTTLQISIWPKPTVYFSSTATCSGDSITFTNLSFISTGSISQTVWRFGDGFNSNSQNPKHLYSSSSGNYNVKLIATSNMGCVDSLQQSIQLYPKPVANFTCLTPSICVGIGVKFGNQSSGDHDFWRFSDGDTSTIRNPTHVFNTTGTYSVTLASISNYGCKDSLIKTFLVSGNPKVNFIAMDTVGCPSFCSTFAGSTLPGSDPISSWVWLFDNGDLGFGPITNFCYDKEGLYSPSLVVKTAQGCVDTLTKPFYINVYTKPKAEFSYDPQEISVIDPLVNFINTSSADIISSLWNFGDQTTSTNSLSVQHQYIPNNADYEYYASLTVTNGYGCQDQVIHPIKVNSESSIYIPNTFTPNEDKINDVFFPVFSGIYANANYEMQIFDRWGEAVFKTNNSTVGWDGNRNDQPSQIGVYTYAIYFFDKADNKLIKKFTNKIILLR